MLSTTYLQLPNGVLSSWIEVLVGAIIAFVKSQGISQLFHGIIGVTVLHRMNEGTSVLTWVAHHGSPLV